MDDGFVAADRDYDLSAMAAFRYSRRRHAISTMLRYPEAAALITFFQELLPISAMRISFADLRFLLLLFLPRRHATCKVPVRCCR